MILELDLSSEIPIYVQLRNQIVMGIARGQLMAGESLPTVRRMAADAGINTMTVNKAYQLLKAEGYIADFEVIDDNKQGIIKVTMKYGANKEKVISGIKKISKPGLKKYAKAGEVPRVLGGLGIAIISTSKGVISDKEARNLGIGGEVICYVW